MNRVQIDEFLPADPGAQDLMNRITANLLFQCTDKKSIAVTSCHAREGKSRLAVQLAYTLAMEGHKVILVDAVAAEASAFRYLTGEQDKESGKNIPDYLKGKYPLSDLYYETEVSNLQVFPLKAYGSDASVPMNPKLLSELLASLAKAYDFIIVDTPAAGQESDAAMIASACDGIVLVVRYRKTKKKEVREIVSQLEKTGTPILGCILNRVKFDCTLSRKRYRLLRKSLSKLKSRGKK